MWMHKLRDSEKSVVHNIALYAGNLYSYNTKKGGDCEMMNMLICLTGDDLIM